MKRATVFLVVLTGSWAFSAVLAAVADSIDDPAHPQLHLLLIEMGILMVLGGVVGATIAAILAGDRS